MREGHLAERDFLVGAFIDLLREPVRTTNDKHHPANATGHALLHILAELHRGHLASVLVKQNHVVALVDTRQDATALALLLLGFALVARVAGILHILDVKGHVVTQARGVIVNAGFQVARRGFSNHQ